MKGPIVVKLPSILVEKLRGMEVDVESLVIDSVLNSLNLDPEEELKVHNELARKFLEEGRDLIDEDPVQASEKLYKAAEEAIKALVLKHRVTDIIRRVKGRGRWKTEDFFNASSTLRNVYGDKLRRHWSTAWELHVWGFHEAKYRIEDIEATLPPAIWMLNITKQTIEAVVHERHRTQTRGK